MDSLSPPPRSFPTAQERAILLGHPAVVTGMLALAVASTLVWLFVAAYGISFSSLRSVFSNREKLPARVESSQQVTLLTGEAAHRTCALFFYQGKTWRAAAYGETSLSPGQEATVVMPAASPAQAWILGLQKFPLRLSGLAQIAVLAFLPGLILTLWGLRGSFGQRRLLREGVIVSGQRLRHLGLPRPLSDRYLDRYELVDPAGRTRRVWSVGPEGPAETSLLVSPRSWRGATVVSHLLPMGGVATSTARRLCAWVVLLIALIQLLVLGLFLLT